MRPTATLVGVLIFAWGGAAAAAMPPIPLEDRFAGAGESDKKSMGAGVGFAGINEDYFVQLTLQSELNFGKVGVGFAIPLNLRVVDKDPENNDDYYGAIRREDW